VDTGGAGSVWGSLGEPLSSGDFASVQIDCSGSPADVNYAIALYDAPTTPFTLSGSATTCPSCSSTNDIGFYPPATAHYAAELTLTQGSVDLSNGHSDQVFASSGTFDLGYLVHGQQHLYLTPLAGPKVEWTISIQLLPVALSGLRFDAPYIRPTQPGRMSYHVDGDVTLSAAIENSATDVVRTIATNLAVPAGDHTLTWDGLDAGGSEVPDGAYTVAVTYTDGSGNSGSGTASVEVDGTPPVVTPASAVTKHSGKLVLDVHDALSGLANAKLSIDAGAVVQSLTSSGTHFTYAPADGWAKGKHTWHVTATDNVGNTGTFSGTFTTGGSFKPAKCHVPTVIGKTRRLARAAILQHLCRVGRVSHKHSRRQRNGRVIAQQPRAGKVLRAHSRVKLTISLGR
jgi:hypothetical protein